MGTMMRKSFFKLILLAGIACTASGALAQSAIEGRVDRLEREMRAVQRKVFPGGNGQYFPPDIAPQQAPVQSPGVPASSAVSDLAARVSSVEAQLTSLTGQIEQNQYKLQQLEDAFNAYKRATDARLKATETEAAGTGGPLPTPTATTPDRPVATTTKPATPTKPAAVDPERAARIAAVPKPQTSDPADDLYVYGYRLWQAKLYPEAEAPLKQVVAKYPAHRRASWAQNLLGRSYLDQGKPSLASHAFYDNYKNFHDGERAPDSLFYLATALKQLGKPSTDVCKVYDELLDVYGTKISATMKADVARNRATEKCK
jgi:TolA-binding protein